MPESWDRGAESSTLPTTTQAAAPEFLSEAQLGKEKVVGHPQGSRHNSKCPRELGRAVSSVLRAEAPPGWGQSSRHRRGCFCRCAFFRALRATLAASRKTSSTFSRNLAEHSR